MKPPIVATTTMRAIKPKLAASSLMSVIRRFPAQLQIRPMTRTVPRATTPIRDRFDRRLYIVSAINQRSGALSSDASGPAACAEPHPNGGAPA